MVARHNSPPRNTLTPLERSCKINGAVQIRLALLFSYRRSLALTVMTTVILRAPCANRRCVPSTWALAALAAAFGGAPAVGDAAPTARPNIIVIMADDLGIGDIGVTGQLARAAAGLPAIPTPHIDELAGQSMSFTRMYSTPICAPTRSQILTGFEMPRQHRDAVQTTNGLRGGELDKTWGQTLQQAGYKTGMFGKWHLGGADWPGGGPLGIYDRDSIPTQKGFDIVYGTLAGGYRNDWLWENDDQGGLKLSRNEYTPEWPGPGLPFRFTEDITTDHMVKMVKDYAGQQPFAIYAAMNAPHDPINWLGVGEFGDRNWPLAQKQYAAMVANLDMNVGRLIAAVNDPNGDGNSADSVADNTLVVFTSDNGPVWDSGSGYRTEFFDSNGIYRSQKSSTYEGGIRTPFFVRWNGVVTPGAVSDRAGSLADVYPTLAELTAQDAPLGLDGVSLLPAITGQGPVKRQDALVWTDRIGLTNIPSWAIQMADWKLVRQMYGGSAELYHISADPAESINLAGDRPDIVDALLDVAGLEGVYDEPFFATSNFSSPYNVAYTQYKNWAPQAGSTDFAAAANWGGGSQYNRPDDPQSLYWNTGPGPVWLATVNNAAGGSLEAIVSADAKVLAVEVRGQAGPMRVSVMAGVVLDAYNGVRIADGGTLRLSGGKLLTGGEVEIRAGGALTGAGIIGGYQNVIAAVPEFQGKHLLEPDVINRGVVDAGDGGAAGLLNIDGTFSQDPTGQLHADLFSGGGVPGIDFDQLSVTGDAVLAGSVHVDLKGSYSPELGALFPIVAADNLSLAGLQLAGPDAGLFNFFVRGGSELVLAYAGPLDGDFDGSGAVNALDLTFWEQRFGGSLAGAPDPLGESIPFLAWQRQFGNGHGQIAAQSGGAASIPEPEAVEALLVATIALTGAGRRRSRERASRKCAPCSPGDAWPREYTARPCQASPSHRRFHSSCCARTRRCVRATHPEIGAIAPPTRTRIVARWSDSLTCPLVVRKTAGIIGPRLDVT